MTSTGGDDWRALLQDFVDARIDAPELFARAARLLPAGADTSEEILERLAETDLQLRPPAGRQAFVRRLEQFAAGETSYAELDLWCFSLWQTELFAPEAAPANPEVSLLQTVLGLIEEWGDEAARPTPAQLQEFARILACEADPAACREQLEAALQ